MNRSRRIILAISVLFVVAFVLYVKSTNHSVAPQAANHKSFAVPAVPPVAQTAEQLAKKSVVAAVAVPRDKRAPAAGSPASSTGGLVAFKDPVTGQLRQPDASEIGELVGTVPLTTLLRRAATMATVEAPTMIPGPGGSIGVKLSDDTLTYMVVTKTPDGQLATECVDGKKAAVAKVVASKPANGKGTQEKKPILETKEITDEK